LIPSSSFTQMTILALVCPTNMVKRRLDCRFTPL